MGLPGSILFCCDHNAVRSPMAEGLMKHLHGRRVFIQSAGIFSDLEVDGFMISVAAEVGIDISNHRSRTFEQMEEWGDDLGAYDQVIALSPGAQRYVLDHTREFHVEVTYWPTLDPTGLGENREDKLAAYRQTRDQLKQRIEAEFPATG
ncbi:MAG: low molecular weight phosphatase family protein [Pseudomonadota bacterium]